MWGAVQHHFGSKEDILDAVMAISHEKFIARVSAPSLRQGSLSCNRALNLPELGQVPTALSTKISHNG